MSRRTKPVSTVRHLGIETAVYAGVPAANRAFRWLQGGRRPIEHRAALTGILFGPRTGLPWEISLRRAIRTGHPAGGG
jgi:hypothetical protein